MPKSLKIGDRIELTADADFRPHAVIGRGERGTVVSAIGNDVDVKLDTHHAGLDCYDNCIWITDYSPPFAFKRLRNYTPRAAMRVVPFAAAAAVALTFALAADWLEFGTNAAHATRPPAIEYREVVAAQSTIHPGDALTLKITNRHNRACAWEFTGTWENTDTRTAFAREKHPGASWEPETEFQTHYVPVAPPKNLPPGHYAYHSIGKGDCTGDGVSEAVVQAPSVYFTVE